MNSALNYAETDVMRVYIKSLVATSRGLREAERHHLDRIARKLRRAYSKKHQKGATKPTPPKEFKLPEKASLFIDEAYTNYFNLHQVRVNQIRKETRAFLLAYNFLRGQDYALSEAHGAYAFPDFEMIWGFVLESTPQVTGDNEKKALVDDFEKWKTKAIIYWNEHNKNRTVA